MLADNHITSQWVLANRLTVVLDRLVVSIGLLRAHTLCALAADYLHMHLLAAELFTFLHFVVVA